MLNMSSNTQYTQYCSMYRVWRYRGGRDGRETLQQFMNFLGHRTKKCVSEREGERGRRDDKVFAGVVAFCVPSALDNENSITDSFQVMCISIYVHQIRYTCVNTMYVTWCIVYMMCCKL